MEDEHGSPAEWKSQDDADMDKLLRDIPEWNSEDDAVTDKLLRDLLEWNSDDDADMDKLLGDCNFLSAPTQERQEDNSGDAREGGLPDVDLQGQIMVQEQDNEDGEQANSNAAAGINRKVADKEKRRMRKEKLEEIYLLSCLMDYKKSTGGLHFEALVKLLSRLSHFPGNKSQVAAKLGDLKEKYNNLQIEGDVEPRALWLELQAEQHAPPEQQADQNATEPQAEDGFLEDYKYLRDTLKSQLWRATLAKVPTDALRDAINGCNEKKKLDDDWHTVHCLETQEEGHANLRRMRLIVDHNKILLGRDPAHAFHEILLCAARLLSCWLVSNF